MSVGIDVSKDKLDICVLPDKEYYTIKNSKAAIANLFRNKLALREVDLVVFEATGGYEKILHEYLLTKTIAHHVVHPLRAHRFAESKGSFAKTDKIDAHGLALYGNQADISPDEPASINQLKLQEYASRRIQLKNELVAETNRLHANRLESQVTRSISRHIKWLEGELMLVTGKLDGLIEANDELQGKLELLQSAKGVGPEVARMLVTNLPELGLLSREEISRLVGVAPRTKDSGKKQGRRPISQGRFYVRKALYMSALTAVRYDSRMKAIYQKLVDKGKAKKVALVAVMRKMIIMLNAMVKNGTPWQCKEI